MTLLKFPSHSYLPVITGIQIWKYSVSSLLGYICLPKRARQKTVCYHRFQDILSFHCKRNLLQHSLYISQYNAYFLPSPQQHDNGWWIAHDLLKAKSFSTETQGRYPLLMLYCAADTSAYKKKNPKILLSLNCNLSFSGHSTILARTSLTLVMSSSILAVLPTLVPSTYTIPPTFIRNIDQYHI